MPNSMEYQHWRARWKLANMETMDNFQSNKANMVNLDIDLVLVIAGSSNTFPNYYYSLFKKLQFKKIPFGRVLRIAPRFKIVSSGINLSSIRIPQMEKRVGGWYSFSFGFQKGDVRWIKTKYRQFLSAFYLKNLFL